jgi:signal transduction histidine kinase/HAMP domain-containing protein
MPLSNTPIRGKLMVIMLLACGLVMLMMRGAFFTYEYLTFRQAMIRHVASLGDIVAANSTAALAAANRDAAREVLGTLKGEPEMQAAALYDQQGRLFAHYPADLDPTRLPAVPAAAGYRFDGTRLAGCEPVRLPGREIGTLYLEFDTSGILHAWLWDSAKIGLGVMGLVLLVAFVVARVLQRQVSQPILALAATARAISERRDYSTRAPRLGNDELGLLTQSFNQMLDEIQALNRDLERRVEERTAQLQAANAELNRSRADLQSLFVSIDEGYGIIEMILNDQGEAIDFRYVLVNPAFEKQSGLTNVQGRRILEMFPDFEHSWFEFFGRVARTGEPIRFQNFSPLVQRWFDVYAFRYGDPARHQVALLFTNITERKQREAEIRQLNAALEQRAAELEAANRELEAFSYSVSHDLRAPLRHIDGFTNLLQKHSAAALDDQGRRFLTTISESARRMGRLIDDLLSFSRMGRAQLQPADVDQDALVATVIREGRYPAGVDWRITSLPRVQGDPAMLRQVWINLIDNAVKYSSKVAQPCVEIGRRHDPVRDEEVSFVRDNGAGFDMRYAAKLFGVFQRLHGANEFEGTGIGLANVHRIITRHGGRIWAEGEPGRGATFSFSLPAPSTHAAP